MAHRVHRGLSLLDVLRSAEPGERMQRALQGVCGAPDGGAAALRTLLTDGGECTEPARLAAFDALMSSGSGASVGTLHELAAAGGKGLDLYRAARLLHIGALLRHCRTATSDSEGTQGNGAAQRDENLAELDEAQHAEAPPLDEDEAAKLEALSEAGLACVGDLVRYCSDDEDLEQHVAALSLELLGALDRPTIRKLVTEGRALCEATALLPSGGGEAWEAPPDDAEPAEPSALDVMCSELMRRVDPPAAPEPTAGQTAGSAGGVAAASAAFDVMAAELGLGSLMFDSVADAAPGPTPGTHSVGC